MSDYRLNCEGFRVRMGDVSMPQVERGLPVRSVDWGGEEYDHLSRYYVDPTSKPGSRKRTDWVFEEEKLAVALDEKNPPRMRRLTVSDFSVPAELLRNPLHKGDYDVPLRLQSPTAIPLGRAALVNIVDFRHQSYLMGEAEIDGLGASIRVQDGRFADPDAPSKAGFSLVLMQEGEPLTLHQEYRPGWTDQLFDLVYIPESQDGIKVLPKERFRDEPPKGGEYGPPEDDEGGSDRHPRRPLLPQATGSAEAEPEIEEIVEAYPPRSL